MLAGFFAPPVIVSHAHDAYLSARAFFAFAKCGVPSSFRYGIMKKCGSFRFRMISQRATKSVFVQTTSAFCACPTRTQLFANVGNAAESNSSVMQVGAVL